MKQFIFPAVVLALLGGLAPALRAGSPCCPCKAQECAANLDAGYAKELLDILQTTHSVDAFVVTLNLLVDADVEPHTAIPLIVRHAERLGIFADTLQLDQEDEDKPSALVIEVLGKLKDQMHAARALKEAPKVSVPSIPVQPMPAPVYVPVQPIAPPACVTGQPMAAPVCVPVEPIAAPKCEDCPCHESKADDNSDYRTPIMPPIPEGSAPSCEEQPTDAQVLRALPKPQPVPFAWEEAHGDIQIIKERLVDRVDPPRFFPLVGLAQLHHCHWKCTVSFTDTVEGSYPFSLKLTQLREQVVYIDRDHLHLSPPITKTTEQQQVFSFYMGFFR